MFLHSACLMFVSQRSKQAWLTKALFVELVRAFMFACCHAIAATSTWWNIGYHASFVVFCSYPVALFVVCVTGEQN
jgi:hypothetical protein